MTSVTPEQQSLCLMSLTAGFVNALLTAMLALDNGPASLDKLTAYGGVLTGNR